jgi:hypothetical protein
MCALSMWGVRGGGELGQIDSLRGVFVGLDLVPPLCQQQGEEGRSEAEGDEEELGIRKREPQQSVVVQPYPSDFLSILLVVSLGVATAHSLQCMASQPRRRSAQGPAAGEMALVVPRGSCELEPTVGEKHPAHS